MKTVTSSVYKAIALFVGLIIWCPTLAFSMRSSIANSMSSLGTSLPKVLATSRGRPIRVVAFASASSSSSWTLSSLTQLRGGAVASDAADKSNPDLESKDELSQDSGSRFLSSSSSSLTSSLLAPFVAFGKAYGTSLQNRPILTKSVTAFFIFGLSDWLAQRIEARGNSTGKKATMTSSSTSKTRTSPSSTATTAAAATNWTRTISSMLVGLLYFGPAAHYWYETIFRILPGTSLGSTLQKAALGQLLFGPTFTCLFFATSLMQAGQFSLGAWGRKIWRDLPGAWKAGLTFWPLVDLVSYGMVKPTYIPLFVNLCSLVWTIYLSLVANKSN